MSKREKIIVVIMVITVLYGVYVFFIASPGKKKKPAAATAPSVVSKTVKIRAAGGGTDRLVNEIKTVLQEDETLRTEKYVAVRAEEAWSRDPFSASDMEIASLDKEESSMRAEEIKLVYSGYVEIGGEAVAIVNGIDYQVGDELESRGYKVTSITPASLTVVDIKGGGKITVPFSEE